MGGNLAQKLRSKAETGARSEIKLLYGQEIWIRSRTPPPKLSLDLRFWSRDGELDMRFWPRGGELDLKFVKMSNLVLSRVDVSDRGFYMTSSLQTQQMSLSKSKTHLRPCCT